MTIDVAFLASLAAAARLAGSEILSWYARSDVHVQRKADHSPVTGADLAANAALAAALPRLLPDVPIVSEETSADEAAAVRALATAPRAWLVDPLDGTSDFLARSGEFTVNVALLDAGRPVVGCVLAPVTGRCYLGAHGLGAFRQDQEGGPLVPTRTRPCDRAHPVCLVSRQHQAGEGVRLAARAPEVIVRPAGSALKYALIADGQADLSLRTTPTSLWDTAAAQCVLEAAGGALVTFAGPPLAYRTGTLRNPPFLAYGDPTVDWRAFLARFEAPQA